MTALDLLPDLASRSFGAAVVAANDEFFADKANLIQPYPPTFAPHTFNARGQVYDGWETRRRRTPGHDWAVVRLGAPGLVRTVTVDTAFFIGNYPPRCSVDGAFVDGYPSPAEVATADWFELVGPSELTGDTTNEFACGSTRRVSHVRLNILPDGGVARLRVRGEVVPDPDWLTGRVDVAAAEHGGTVLDCSNRFYSTPANLLLPGSAATMGEGWETARRRDDGNDWVRVKLAGEAVIGQVVVDTSHFVGNAPGWCRLTTGDGVELIGRTRLQPDTRHRFAVPPGAAPTGEVRLDVYPDGGFARLRVLGELTDAGLAAVTERWTATG